MRASRPVSCSTAPPQERSRNDISDFARDNSNAPISVIPEPGSLALLCTGGLPLFGLAWSRRKRAA